MSSRLQPRWAATAAFANHNECCTMVRRSGRRVLLLSKRLRAFYKEQQMHAKEQECAERERSDTTKRKRKQPLTVGARKNMPLYLNLYAMWTMLHDIFPLTFVPRLSCMLDWSSDNVRKAIPARCRHRWFIGWRCEGWDQRRPATAPTERHQLSQRHSRKVEYFLWCSSFPDVAKSRRVAWGTCIIIEVVYSTYEWASK